MEADREPPISHFKNRHGLPMGPGPKITWGEKRRFRLFENWSFLLEKKVKFGKASMRDDVIQLPLSFQNNV